jgi:hypothetical protein
MSSEQIHAVVGEPMPECPIPIRADGTVEHAACVLDPVQLHLVLGCDVSPYHEEAIRMACAGDDIPADGWQILDSASKQRLWMWEITPHRQSALMVLELFLRPGHIFLPRQTMWVLRYPIHELCDGCLHDTAQRLGDTGQALAQQPSKGLASTIIVVGRDHRVLGISKVACHNAVAQEWLMQLACQSSHALGGWYFLGPARRAATIWHMSGQPDVLRDNGDCMTADRWLWQHGWWLPTPDQMAELDRRRGRRQAARRRRGR